MADLVTITETIGRGAGPSSWFCLFRAAYPLACRGRDTIMILPQCEQGRTERRYAMVKIGNVSEKSCHPWKKWKRIIQNFSFCLGQKGADGRLSLLGYQTGKSEGMKEGVEKVRERSDPRRGTWSDCSGRKASGLAPSPT